MRHTVVKPRYTNMKNQSEISWKFPAHPPPQSQRNCNEQAKRISFQIAQARRAWATSINLHPVYKQKKFIIRFLFDTCERQWSRLKPSRFAFLDRRVFLYLIRLGKLAQKDLSFLYAVLPIHMLVVSVWRYCFWWLSRDSVTYIVRVPSFVRRLL